VTKPVDQEVLDNIVNSTFSADCFNVGFKLVDEDDAPSLPDGSSKEECFAWVDSLPSYTPPTWIGLDASAEEVLAKNMAESVLSKVLQVSERQKEASE